MKRLATGRVALAWLGLLSVVVAGCAGRQRLPKGAAPGPDAVGIYRGRLAEGTASARSFRLLLHATLPDRLHAEVLGPIGGPQLILDGGDGKLAVTVVEEGRTYVGGAGADTLGRVLGVELSLADLVVALVSGEDRGGCRVERKAAAPASLPRSVSIACDRARLELELRRFVRLTWPAESLGTGAAPGGTEILPLEALELAPLGQPERSP